VGQTKTEPTVRLYALLARDAKVGVIFRRGPSKQVRLIRWCTDSDTFEKGQWLSGRIYDRRCDLSPDGEHLIYFAGKYKKDPPTFSAVCRPPWFTAVLFWPKGDAWGGGGLFGSDSRILLNHQGSHRVLGEGYHLPPGVQVDPLHDGAGCGEDSPIWDMRLQRDGWTLIQKGHVAEHDFDAKVAWMYDPPQVWAKPRPPGHSDRPHTTLELRMSIHGVHEKEGPWYMIEHEVVNAKGKTAVSLGRTNWADWCHDRDLVFARHGCLYRLGFRKDDTLRPMEQVQLLDDLTSDRFEGIKPPPGADRWQG
jgi:hypothetical protein